MLVQGQVINGNSGGPLFDSQGNLIGIVSAKHTGAENVGYAIKASYLRNLMESSLTEDVLPVNNSVSSLPLTEKVKKVKKFVYFIECNSNDFLSETNKKDVLPIDETPENESQNGEIIIEHPNKESTASYGKYGQDSASCVKYLAYYKAYYKQKNHNNAYSYWKEAFNACPPYANQTMLIDGTSLLRTEIKESKDGREKEKLINQLLILHH